MRLLLLLSFGLLCKSGAAQITFSAATGFYTDDLVINISCAIPDLDIYYTTDGTEPTPDALLYQQSLPFRQLPLTTDSLATIQTSYLWKLPAGEVSRAVHLRARAFRGSEPVGTTDAVTYFRKNQHFHLPVVALNVNEADLIGREKGIYVAGEADNYNQRGRAWERPVQAVFFDKNHHLLLAQTCGVRVGGASTRVHPQKTLRLYARSDYGEKRFSYPFWGADYGTDFKKITLRTLYVPPWSRALVMDDFAHRIIDGKVQTDYVRTKLVVVFINGVYWGIHSMREHNNDDFLARKYDLNDDDINTYSKADYLDGNAELFAALVADLSSLNLKNQSDFQRISERLDVYALADYVIINLATANKDWPHNNLEWWSAATYDNKIRFIVNDLDATFQTADHDRLDWYLNDKKAVEDAEYAAWTVLFLQKLLDNTDYRRHFNRRMNELLQTTFSPERTITIWQELITELRPAMDAHIRRWHFPLSIEDWETAVAEVEKFLPQRTKYLARKMDKYLGDPIHLFPNPTHATVTVDFELWEASDVQFMITDVQGRTHLREQSLYTEGVQQKTFQLQQLSPGIYHLTIQSATGTQRQRIVKY